jgi:AraC family transcriptional regulator, activator of mtrCDE
MDALSKVITLANIQGSLDLRCQMAGGFELEHEQLVPGEAPFHLVLAGRTQLKLSRGKSLELMAGDFVLLPRGSAHVVHGISKAKTGAVQMQDDGPLPERRNTDGAVDMDLLCGRFTYSPGSADLVMSALPDVLHISLAKESKLDMLNGIVALLRDEVMELRSGALAIVTFLSQVLFVMALRTYAQREGIPASLLVLLGDNRLSYAILAMLKEPEKPWTVDTLAKQANMSRATFARHFTEKGNMSPMDLLTSLRMQLACGLLETSNLPSASIGERVGYQSESAFAKVFQKKVGCTPSSFRRQRKQGL